MSTNFSINLFGSLITKTGRKVQFTDFDENGDNVISTKEYNSLVKELNLDKISFKNVDTDGDKKISQSEFELWEQKVEMQNLLNEKLALLSADTKLSPSEKTEIKAQLVSHLNNFIDGYT